MHKGSLKILMATIRILKEAHLRGIVFTNESYVCACGCANCVTRLTHVHVITEIYRVWLYTEISTLDTMHHQILDGNTTRNWTNNKRLIQVIAMSAKLYSNQLTGIRRQRIPPSPLAV